jgi:hypothetical protein
MSRKPIPTLSLVAVLGLLGSAAAAEPPKAGTKAVSGPAITLGCKGPGPSELSYRDHVLKNTTRHELLPGTRVFWTTNNGGSGIALLDTHLAPEATFRVRESGRTKGYACTARFYAGSADLAIRLVQWTDATTASVEVVNLNPWVDAPASVLKLQALKCPATEVVRVSLPVGAIERAGVRVLTPSIAQDGADYLLATANATNTFTEDETLNNARRSVEFSTKKRCSAP